MSNLAAFMANNVEKVENKKVIVSKRFKDKDGNPIPFEVSCVTSEEDEALRIACTKRIPIQGMKGQFTKETDYNKYLVELAVMCTVYPNLNDSELQDSYKVMGASTLLKTMLLPGEYADYLTKVQEINGFETTMDELVDEAKN